MAEADDLRRRQALATLEALMRIGEDLLGRAVDLAPVEEGTLRGSAALAFIINGVRVEGPGAYQKARAVVSRMAPTGLLKTIDVQVVFNTIYAARQHEELSWQHPLGGQAKYLEQPYRANESRYRGILELAGRNALS